MPNDNETARQQRERVEARAMTQEMEKAGAAQLSKGHPQRPMMLQEIEAAQRENERVQLQKAVERGAETGAAFAAASAVLPAAELAKLRAQSEPGPASIINVTTHEPARTPRAADNSRSEWTSEFSAERYLFTQEVYGVRVANRDGTGVTVLLPWPSIRHVVEAHRG